MNTPQRLKTNPLIIDGAPTCHNCGNPAVMSGSHPDAGHCYVCNDCWRGQGFRNLKRWDWWRKPTTPTIGLPVVSADLFASDLDDETYVILDKSGQQKMLMTRRPGNKWKLYALIDSDQYRSDLMERHGISHANAKPVRDDG